MTALIVIANLASFVGLFVGVFIANAFLTLMTIGFETGARMLALTQGDLQARKRFRIQTLALAAALAAIFIALYQFLGAELWNTYVLAGNIGAFLGLAAQYKMDFHRLKPTNGK